MCDKCRIEKEKEQELERFSKAQHYSIKECPPERCEMMYSDSYDYNEGYFSEIEELEEYCEDNDIKMPDYVWCTSSHQLNIDIDSMVENECEDLHEDAYEWIAQKDIEELRTFVNGWCEKQTGTRTFYVDYSAVIVLDKRNKEKPE